MNQPTLFGPYWVVEVELMTLAFVLCSLIGLERQLRQKAAGYRTHVLVGIGSCAFTLVSGLGFSLTGGPGGDPGRVAAQVVSGIGFLGAGVIFKGRSAVRGLTTAATIWVAAAVGMAAGAGLVSLAIMLTLLHLVTLFVVAPLARLIPTPDGRRTVAITYSDGKGVLRDILGAASDMGFSTTIDETTRVNGAPTPQVKVTARFYGKNPISDLIPELLELDGVIGVRVHVQTDHDGDGD